MNKLTAEERAREVWTAMQDVWGVNASQDVIAAGITDAIRAEREALSKVTRDMMAAATNAEVEHFKLQGQTFRTLPTMLVKKAYEAMIAQAIEARTDAANEGGGDG